jgi:hypothetical protein
MIKTAYEDGFNEGLRKELEKLLKARFGPLSLRMRQRLQDLPPARIMELGRAAMEMKSIRELGLED